MAQHSAESARQTGMPKPLDEALKEVVPIITDITEAYKENAGGRQDWNACIFAIVDLCLAAGLAYKDRKIPRLCGVHPETCARLGVDPVKAQQLALRVSQEGYSEQKLGNPMGFEKAAPGPAASAQRRFMEENFQMSDRSQRDFFPWM